MIEFDNFVVNSIENYMKLSTDLKGRLRNIALPSTDSLLPLYEAVVNSIHAIDERIDCDSDFTMDNARIKICIEREGNTLDSSVKGDLIGFTVEDNGIGFTKSNYDSFQTLDSTYKKKQRLQGYWPFIVA